MWLNPKLLGQSFTNNDEVIGSDWRNFGGYRLVPIPVNNFAINANGQKVQRWPPPVVIGDSPYQVSTGETSSGLKTIDVESGIQSLPVPTYNNLTRLYNKPANIDEQLQYKRSLYIEDDSSLVFIRHTLINVGEKAVQRGIMISSQHISRSRPELEDGENFRVYIPFDEALTLPDGELFHINVAPENRWHYVNENRKALDRNNPEHVAKFLNHGTNWNGEVAKGIYEIEYDYYLMGGFHMIAAKPWLAYVNMLEQTAFVKIMEPYDPNKTYEFGINMSIFNSGLETGYLETEVKTPIYNLAAGERANYQEIQAAAKILSTPILDVNMAGIITKKLAYEKGKKTISGEYGFFKAGNLVAQLRDDKGLIIANVKRDSVTPLAGLSFKLALSDYPNASQVRLFILDEKGQKHLLDSANIQ